MKENNNNWLSSLGAYVIALPVTMLFLANVAWATSLAWNLVMPYLFNIRMLGMAETFALIVLIGVFRGVKPTDSIEDKTAKQKLAYLGKVLLMPWFGYFVILATFKLFI